MATLISRSTISFVDIFFLPFCNILCYTYSCTNCAALRRNTSVQHSRYSPLIVLP
nr:MAG TPA: hypothetical protein [Caudoviricetes sp.]